MKKIKLKKNKIVVNKEKKSIIPYSLKKIKTNPTEEYSTLNPLINSLSPSAKSKGARLHSITHETHQNKKIIHSSPGNLCLKEKKLILKKIIKGNSKIKFILIS